MSNTPDEPFFNVEPKTREQRKALTSKDYLEKERIKARHNGKYDPPDNPLQAEKNSPASIDEYDRFQKDASVELKQKKEAQIHKKEAHFEKKREAAYNAEKTRWEKLERMHEQQESKFETKRQQATGALRNRSGESFNIITQEYSTNPGGEALKKMDDATRHKAQSRAEYLDKKGHSVSHDIITGNPLPSTARLVAPWDK